MNANPSAKTYREEFDGDLLEIPEQEWPCLRDLYLRDWPKHVMTYHTIENYIRWGKANQNAKDVRILTTDRQWRQHGTYILEDRNALRYNVLLNTLEPAKHELLLQALTHLPRRPAYTLTAYVEQVRPIVELHLEGLGIKDFTVGYCPTVLYYKSKEACRNLEIPPLQEGFYVKPLAVKHVPQINNLWPHKHPGSDYFIQRVIAYNPTFGIFAKDTEEPCAWVMQLQVGTIGILQVEEAYRRRGFAEHLVRVLCRHMASSNMDATANVMDSNVSSRRLFEKLGFAVVGRVYWYDKPATYDDAKQYICSQPITGLRVLAPGKVAQSSS